MKRLSLTLLAAGTLTAPALACDLCTIYSAAHSRGELGSGFYAAVAEQYTYFGTLQEDGSQINDPAHQHLASSITQMAVGYNFGERVGVQFNVPMIYRSFKRADGFALDHGTESGIGDVSFSAHWTPVRVEKMSYTLQWSVLGGMKFPTGSSDRLKEELTEVEIPGAPESGIHGHDLALGSGSYDGFVGTGFYVRHRHVFASLNAQYTIRSRGDLGYRYANDLNWWGGPGVYLVLNDNWSLAVSAIVSGEYKGMDHFQGAHAEDTAITAVYVGPQVSFTWSDKLSVELGLDVPFHQQNSSIQTVPDYRVRTAVTWHF